MSNARVLYFDRTEDEDLMEIQKMAATLYAFFCADDVGFTGIHMQFENDPTSDAVTWKRTKDGYALHLCAKDGKYWCQTAYQLGYLMMHCLIDHLGDGEEDIVWAEELICEAAALRLLQLLHEHWEHTPFYREDPDYAPYIKDYLEANFSDEGTAAILRCGSKSELAQINARNLFEDRIEESHDLLRAMEPGDLQILAGIREYEADGLLLYTHYWRGFSRGSKAVDWLCRLQERIPGCTIPAGVSQNVDLENSVPTQAQKRSFGCMIRALNHMPGEYIIFSFMDPDKEQGRIGLAYCQMLRSRSGQIMVEVQLNTAKEPRMYRAYMDEDAAVETLNRILETNEPPDITRWEDVTDQILRRED